jgi:uncharacterized protein YjbI with pentapeptide repeats
MKIKFEGETIIQDIEALQAKNCLVYEINFHRAIFENETFENVRFEECQMRNATFKNLILKNCVFSYCNLSLSFFSQVQFINCKVESCLLFLAEITDTTIQGLKILDCHFEKTKFISNNYLSDISFEKNLGDYFLETTHLHTSV